MMSNKKIILLFNGTMGEICKWSLLIFCITTIITFFVLIYCSSFLKQYSWIIDYFTASFVVGLISMTITYFILKRKWKGELSQEDLALLISLLALIVSFIIIIRN